MGSLFGKLAAAEERERRKRQPKSHFQGVYVFVPRMPYATSHQSVSQSIGDQVQKSKRKYSLGESAIVLLPSTGAFHIRRFVSLGMARLGCFLSQITSSTISSSNLLVIESKCSSQHSKSLLLALLSNGSNPIYSSEARRCSTSTTHIRSCKSRASSTI